MRVLVAYNGSLNSRAAIRQGISKVREHGGMLIVLHVFHCNMFIDYDAGPNARIMARDDAFRFVEEAKKILEDEGGGIWSRVVVTEGNPEEEILRFAREENISIIFAPQYYIQHSIPRSIPCPLFIIPGPEVYAGPGFLPALNS